MLTVSPHALIVCSSGLRTALLSFAAFWVSATSDQWQERDEWEASHPSGCTPRWLSSHWRHRHGQTFLWPARARTKIPARNLRHDHTQGASTQCAELPAGWLGGAPSSMPPDSQCAVSGQGSQDDPQPLISACLSIHRVQQKTGVHRMNSSHRPRRRRTQPHSPSSLKNYRHIGKSCSARGRSADRLSGKADRLGRHVQGWCAKGAPTTHQCRLSGNFRVRSLSKVSIARAAAQHVRETSSDP